MGSSVSWLLGAPAVALLLSTQATQAAQSARAEDPLLAPGPHSVGFRHTWAFDAGRTWRTSYDEGATYGADKAPRPLLILAWHPAQPDVAERARMRHGDYLEIQSPDERLEALARALAAHARAVLVEQVLGRPEAELGDEERAELQRVLAAPTLCLREAEPLAGPFPLVLHHSGAGSSYEDDAAFCEQLASHGYFVLASSYFSADGTRLAVDGGRGSIEDARFLVRWASMLEQVDWRRVALVGHSLGAQAFLKLSAEPGSFADALVLLDTTQDYYGLSLPVHEQLVREVSMGAAQIRVPMLVATGPDASFSLCDTLVQAERFYATLPDLTHDEFISQGFQRLRVLESRAPADAAEVERAPRARASYRVLCELVRSFLDAQLGRGSEDFERRIALDRARPWTHTEPRLVHVPRGTSAPEPYDDSSSEPPTPRQFTRLVLEHGAEPACQVLARFRDTEPRGPLFTSTMLAGSLLYELYERGRVEEARLYHAKLRELPLDALSLLDFLAHIAQLQSKPDRALKLLRMACELDPSDSERAARLQELEDRENR